jgi:SAM-dependent methyltransferase
VVDEVVHLAQAPLAHVVASGHVPTTADFGTINLVRCRGCGHAWNTAAESVVGHHVDFLTNAPVSKGMVARHHDLVAYVTAGLPKRLRVLDVGAGSGALSLACADAGHEVIAVEPSGALDAAVMQAAGVRVVADAWPSNSLSGETFDLVVCVQMLEHTLTPATIAASVAAALARDGRAYIEVPSGDWLWRHHSPIDVHAPHVQYFTDVSFAQIAHRAGVTVIDRHEVVAGRDVGYVVVKRSDTTNGRTGEFGPTGVRAASRRSDVADAPARFANAVTLLQQRLAQLAGRVALYGANAGTQALLGWVPEGPWDAVLDDTPAYWGHQVVSTAGTTPIVDPNTVDLDAYDTILIAAYVHDAAIARRLRERGFRGEVRSLRPPTAVTDGPPSLMA